MWLNNRKNKQFQNSEKIDLTDKPAVVETRTESALIVVTTTSSLAWWFATAKTAGVILPATASTVLMKAPVAVAVGATLTATSTIVIPTVIGCGFIIATASYFFKKSRSANMPIPIAQNIFDNLNQESAQILGKAIAEEIGKEISSQILNNLNLRNEGNVSPLQVNVFCPITFFNIAQANGPNSIATVGHNINNNHSGIQDINKPTYSIM